MSDAITILEAAASEQAVRLRVRVDPGSRLLDGHFPGEPVVPGVAHLEMVCEGVRRLARGEVRLTELRGFRLRRPLPPGEACQVDVSRGSEPGTFAFCVRTPDGVASAGTLRAADVG